MDETQALAHVRKIAKMMQQSTQEGGIQLAEFHWPAQHQAVLEHVRVNLVRILKSYAYLKPMDMALVATHILVQVMIQKGMFPLVTEPSSPPKTVAEVH